MNDAQLYHLLFNAITDAIEAMQKMNCGQALEILKKAQQDTEEAYLQREETDKSEDYMPCNRGSVKIQ